MRNKAIFLLIPLLAAAIVHGEGIRYDRIPADVTAYVHMDFDRFLSSSWARQWGDAAQEQTAMLNTLLGQHSDITMYAPKTGGPGGYVLIFHTRDPQLRQRIEANSAKAKTIVKFMYEQQEILYASANLPELWGMPSDLLPPEAQESAKNPEAPTQEPSSTVTVGFGLGQGDFRKGPTYTAFVGQDLIVIAGDLPSIAIALDVIQGKKPSLAQQDPQGLKINAPPGVIIVGAGVTAALSQENSRKADSATQLDSDEYDDGSGLLQQRQVHHRSGGPGSATQPANSVSKDYGYDLFGSVKANTRLARMDMGENDRQVYVDATITMKDVESADQMKNLLIGLKAMISLSKVNAKPVLAPVEISSAQKDVVLHWSWPAAKITELPTFLQLPSTHEHSMPATAPATSPAH